MSQARRASINQHKQRRQEFQNIHAFERTQTEVASSFFQLRSLHRTASCLLFSFVQIDAAYSYCSALPSLVAYRACGVSGKCCCLLVAFHFSPVFIYHAIIQMDVAGIRKDSLEMDDHVRH